MPVWTTHHLTWHPLSHSCASRVLLSCPHSHQTKCTNTLPKSLPIGVSFFFFSFLHSRSLLPSGNAQSFHLSYGFYLLSLFRQLGSFSCLSFSYTFNLSSLLDHSVSPHPECHVIYFSAVLRGQTSLKVWAQGLSPLPTYAHMSPPASGLAGALHHSPVSLPVKVSTVFIPPSPRSFF